MTYDEAMRIAEQKVPKRYPVQAGLESGQAPYTYFLTVSAAIEFKREAKRDEEAALIALLAQPGDIVRVSGGYMRLERVSPSPRDVEDESPRMVDKP